MKKILLSFLTLLLGLHVSAAPNALSNAHTISKYQIGSTGHLYVYTQDGNYKNPKPCDKNYHYILPASSPSYDKFFAAILASFYSGQKMKFIISGTECNIERPTIITIQGL